MIRILAALDRHAGWITATIAALCLLLALAILLSGCNAPPSPRPLGDTPVPSTQAEADPVVQLRGERDELRGKLAGVESRLKAAEYEATVAPLRALTRWAAYIGGAVAGLALVALVLVRFGLGLPLGNRLLIGLGLAGLALSAAAVGLGQALPWIGPIGLGILVLLVLVGLGWAALTWKRGGEAAASEWVRYACALDDERRKELDAMSLPLQGRAAATVNRLLPPPTNNPGTQ